MHHAYHHHYSTLLEILDPNLMLNNPFLFHIEQNVFLIAH